MLLLKMGNFRQIVDDDIRLVRIARERDTKFSVMNQSRALNSSRRQFFAAIPSFSIKAFSSAKDFLANFV